MYRDCVAIYLFVLILFPWARYPAESRYRIINKISLWKIFLFFSRYCIYCNFVLYTGCTNYLISKRQRWFWSHVLIQAVLMKLSLFSSSSSLKSDNLCPAWCLKVVLKERNLKCLFIHQHPIEWKEFSSMGLY